jgi:hypothetical protein
VKKKTEGVRGGMKDITEHIKDGAGLPSAERYLLAALKAGGADIAPLYMDSFVEPQRVIEDCLAGVNGYEEYNGFGRIFERASLSGVIAYTSDSAAIRGGGYPYILRGVTNEFYKKVSNLFARSSSQPLQASRSSSRNESEDFRAWPTGHYILETAGGFYDCCPPRRLDIPALTLLPVFDGRDMAFAVEAPESKRPDLRAELAERIKKEVFVPIEFGFALENLTHIRAALRTVKISRIRINRILGIALIDEELCELHRLIALSEIYGRRGGIGDYAQQLRRLNALEKKWRELLRNEAYPPNKLPCCNAHICGIREAV